MSHIVAEATLALNFLRDKADCLYNCTAPIRLDRILPIVSEYLTPAYVADAISNVV